MSFDRSYRALGFAFRIRANRLGIGLLLDGLLAPFRHDTDEVLPTYFFVEGEDRASLVMARGWLRDAPTAAELIDFVMWDVHMEAIRRSEPYLALHAAAAAVKGQGVIIAGRQDAGKSTLVAGLTAAGFDYLTDECALIDLHTGLLEPFPKALCLSRASVDAIPGLFDRLPIELRARPRAQYHVAPSAIRPDAIGSACQPKRIVFPQYEEGETALEPVSRGWALNALVTDSFNFEQYGAPGIAALAALVSDTECFRLRVGNLDDAVAILTQSESLLAPIPG